MNPIRMKRKIKKLYPEWSDSKIYGVIQQIQLDNSFNTDYIFNIEKCERGGIQVQAVQSNLDIEKIFKEMAKNIVDSYGFMLAKEYGDTTKAAKESSIKLMRLLNEAIQEMTEDR